MFELDFNDDSGFAHDDVSLSEDDRQEAIEALGAILHG